MARFAQGLSLAFYLLAAIPSGWCDEELTVDLYQPKYAFNSKGSSDPQPYALPADPLALLAKVVDPKTKQPIHIYFVNNTSPEGGDGSFEHPFNTLKAAENAAQSYDVIYLFRGDGTAKGMDSGICLKDHQHLLGSSYPYAFETPYGTLFFPAMSLEAPVIAHASGNAIELASHNEVNGLEIRHALGWGIHGKQIQEGHYQHLAIHADGKHGGIGLEDVLGHFSIVDNSLDGSQRKHVNGIDIRNHGVSMANFTLRRNNIAHFDAGILLLTFDNSIALTNIAQNTIGACLKDEINAEAYDTSELHSFIADNLLSRSR